MAVTLVHPYDPAWPAHFVQVRKFLESGMGDVDCAFEHVGSTAIPGMVAKPIIDLNLVIASGDFEKIKARLEALGYVHQGDLGIPKREAFDLVDAEVKARLPKDHLYVCEAGVYELLKQLAFRDFMRVHPEWRVKLSQLKRELCVEHNNDRQSYIDGKSDMVQEITKLAMAPRFEKRGAFRVLGVEDDAWKIEEADPGFHDLWMNRFMAKHDEVQPHSTDGAYYAVWFDTTANDISRGKHLAGMAVDDGAAAPEGWVLREVAPTQYAVFETTLRDVGGATEHALNRWLPDSEYEYDTSKPRFDLMPPDTTGPQTPVTVWVPVIGKS